MRTWNRQREASKPIVKTRSLCGEREGALALSGSNDESKFSNYLSFHLVSPSTTYTMARSERADVCIQIPQYIRICLHLFAEEVDYLSRNWSSFTSHEFTVIKDRLAV